MAGQDPHRSGGVPLSRSIPSCSLTRALGTAAAAVALGLGCLTAAPAVATEVGAGEGCTPGYWKNHPDAWLENPGDTTSVYDAGTPLTTVSGGFEAYLPGYTVDDALQGGGGRGLEGAARILARAATASYLNATVEIAFPLRRSEISAQVDAALASGDRATILDLAGYLDGLNNAGCPLG